MVGAARVDVRLLIHTFFGETSSTSLFDTTDRGANSVMSILSFANSSLCFNSSHSLPLSPLRPRPLMRTSAHSPNIFLPWSRNVSLPPFSALTASSPGSTKSHVPSSQMMTFPAP